MALDLEEREGGPVSQETMCTEDVPWCPLCGNDSRRVLYTGLKDRLFGALGEWNFKECCRCGLVFIDPRPTLEEIGKAYAGYCTHFFPDPSGKTSLLHRIYKSVKSGYLGKRWGYDGGLRLWQTLLASLLYLTPSRRVDLDFSVMYLQATPGGRVIDVGCGNGELIERLGDLGWEAQGVDVDELAVRVANKRGLRAHIGTLESQNYPENSFDAVTVSHVIEHVHDPRSLLRECYRILKPRGRLIIATPNANSWGHNKYDSNWIGLDPPRHLHIFAPASLQYLVEQTGFRDVHVATSVRLADTLFAASESIRRTGRHAMGSQLPVIPIWAKAMQLIEWMLLNINPSLGEEIIVIAKKQGIGFE